MQEALFQAYRKLDTFDDARPLAPWLFRIAHNRCIDFLRRRGVREEAETAAMAPDVVLPADPPGPDLGRAVEHLVLALPPKERACVLLKDVFDYSLEEIAELVDSTVGGVKAALSRGRSKLAPRPEPPASSSVELSRLLHLYVERLPKIDILVAPMPFLGSDAGRLSAFRLASASHVLRQSLEAFILVGITPSKNSASADRHLCQAFFLS